MEAVKLSGVDLQNHFGVPFEDLVSALGQVVFANGKPSMLLLQGAGLLHQGYTTLERDDGIKIKKKYVLRRLHSIEGKIKSLNEGYKVLRGSVNLDDPGTEKLLLTMDELDKLLTEFSGVLGDSNLETVNRRFTVYKGMFTTSRAFVYD